MKIKKWNGSAWVQDYPEVNVANIVATGTASSSTFLRGDGQWATPSDTTTLSSLGITATTAELNKLDGVTATTTELNYVDGVTSAIQTQLDGKLTGNQTITLSGDVSGSGTTSISVTVADDSHNHIIANVDGLQTALNGKAPKASPALTGTPTAPTATAGTNTTQIATTAFVGTAVSNLVDSSPQTLDTLNELAAALGDDPNFATTVSTNLGNKLDKSGGTITGSLRVDGGVEIGGDLEVVGNSIGFIDTNFDAKIEVSDSNPNGTGAVFNFYGDASSRNATISAEQFDGNAATTTKLLNARNIALTGDVTGSANFDGSANISITATVADDSHNHTIANVDGLQAELDSIPTNNNQLTNGAGYTTNVGDITEVTTSGGLTGGGSSGSVDVSIDTTGATNGEVLTYGPVGPYWSTLADSDNYDGWDLYTDGTSRGRISSGENVDFVGGTDISLSYSSTNNTITISSTASGGSGTVTSVATGGGLTGGTITSSGTISHADTSSQASVNNSGTTFIQDVTLDTYGHVTGLTSSTISNNISGSTFMTAYDPDIGSLLQYGLYGWQTIDVGSQGQVLTVGGSSYNQFSDNDGGWTEIKTGSTQVLGGTGVTSVTLSSAISDTSVIAFELNTSSVLSNTSQIFIVKVENASNTAAGVLFNAYASSTLIRTGSIRVYRGANTTTLNFSYSYYVNSGSSSEATDTVFVGKIWKLNGRTGV